jgi:hypothetical protein
MSYAKAITMIDDLPPMIQTRSPYTGYPYSRSHMETHQGMDDSLLPNSMDTNYYAEIVDKIPSISKKIRQYEKQNIYDEYQRKTNLPSNLRNDYFPGDNLIGLSSSGEVNHLPVLDNQTVNPKGYSNLKNNTTYPVIENFNLIPCRDILNHVENCPICKKLFKKNDLLLYTIIAILILVIILFLLQNKTQK